MASFLFVRWVNFSIKPTDFHFLEEKKRRKRLKSIVSICVCVQIIVTLKFKFCNVADMFGILFSVFSNRVKYKWRVCDWYHELLNRDRQFELEYSMIWSITFLCLETFPASFLCGNVQLALIDLWTFEKFILIYSLRTELIM